MPVDQQWIDTLWADETLEGREGFVVGHVSIEMPIGRKSYEDVHRSWQRRILDDILPDSPNADAPEKIPFRILKNLTVSESTQYSLQEVVAGEFEGLKPIFWRGNVPVAFHVLAVRGAARAVEGRAFTERTFLLLMRGADGRINEPLLTRFLERFRVASDTLDLAQSYVLEHIEPDWDPATQFRVDYEDFLEPVPPFMEDASALFQRDIQTLLDANLPSADHFQHVNTLLALHLGLYLPRLALRLNPAIDLLAEGLTDVESVELELLKAVESGRHMRSNFEGRLSLRAPSMGAHRPMTLNALAHTSYDEMSNSVAELHFSLMLFHRLRELSKSYILATNQNATADELFRLTRRPSNIGALLQTEPEFHNYLARALEVLCVRYIKEQLTDKNQTRGREILRNAKNGLVALRKCYEIYNLQTSSRGNKSRAYKQGTEVVDRLLKHSEYGIIQARRGLGSYFELGVGLIPLLLLLVVGSGREKIQVADYWQKLAEYGLGFEAEERQILLSRLKSMGLYERFSDAGEANYIRNLLVGSRA